MPQRNRIKINEIGRMAFQLKDWASCELMKGDVLFNFFLAFQAKRLSLDLDPGNKNRKIYSG